MDGVALRSGVPEGWAPFYVVPKFVYEKHLLKYATDSERVVFHALCNYRWNNTRMVTVSLPQLARAANKCRKTVIAATQGLEFLGLIAKCGTDDYRVMRYELLPHGAAYPPNVDEIVTKRSKAPRRRPSRDAKGRFKSQDVETAKSDQSTGSGLVRSSGSGL